MKYRARRVGNNPTCRLAMMNEQPRRSKLVVVVAAVVVAAVVDIVPEQAVELPVGCKDSFLPL